MSEKQVKNVSSSNERLEFINHLLDDVEALEYMLKNDMFESGIVRIGAEQEFCLVNNDMTPSMKALEVLESLNDSDFTTELAKYNLELNLPPQELKTTCFTDTEDFLLEKNGEST